MTTSSAIKSKLQSLQEIEDIISSMKAFANFNVQTAKNSLSNLRIYQNSIEDSFDDIITLFPRLAKRSSDKTHGAIYVLFLSQEGLCGFFNEDIVYFFETLSRENAMTVIVGAKGIDVAEAKKIKYDHYLSGAANVEAIEMSAIELSAYLIETFEKKHFGTLHLVYAQLEGESYKTVKKKVLPPDFSKFSKKSIQKEPLLYLKAEDILHTLIKEYLHISIYRAFIESVASENQARLNAMVHASNAIEHKEKHLTQSLNVQRQKEITDELLEIVNAYRSALDH